MSNTRGPDDPTNQPRIYQICVQGHLGRQWSDRFDGFSITQEDDGTTLLTGAVIDQAALHGILRQIRDLGITLLKVYSVDSSQMDPSERS